MNGFQINDRVRVDRRDTPHQHGREGTVVGRCIHLGQDACNVHLDPTPDPAVPCHFPIPVKYLTWIGHARPAQQDTGTPGEQT